MDQSKEEEPKDDVSPSEPQPAAQPNPDDMQLDPSDLPQSQSVPSDSPSVPAHPPEPTPVSGSAKGNVGLNSAPVEKKKPASARRRRRKASPSEPRGSSPPRTKRQLRKQLSAPASATYTEDANFPGEPSPLPRSDPAFSHLVRQESTGSSTATEVSEIPSDTESPENSNLGTGGYRQRRWQRPPLVAQASMESSQASSGGSYSPPHYSVLEPLVTDTTSSDSPVTSQIEQVTRHVDPTLVSPQPQVDQSEERMLWQTSHSSSTLEPDFTPAALQSETQPDAASSLLQSSTEGETREGVSLPEQLVSGETIPQIGSNVSSQKPEELPLECQDQATEFATTEASQEQYSDPLSSSATYIDFVKELTEVIMNIALKMDSEDRETKIAETISEFFRTHKLQFGAKVKTGDAKSAFFSESCEEGTPPYPISSTTSRTRSSDNLPKNVGLPTDSQANVEEYGSKIATAAADLGGEITLPAADTAPPRPSAPKPARYLKESQKVPALKDTSSQKPPALPGATLEESSFSGVHLPRGRQPLPAEIRLDKRYKFKEDDEYVFEPMEFFRRSRSRTPQPSSHAEASTSEGQPTCTEHQPTPAVTDTYAEGAAAAETLNIPTSKPEAQTATPPTPVKPTPPTPIKPPAHRVDESIISSASKSAVEFIRQTVVNKSKRFLEKGRKKKKKKKNGSESDKPKAPMSEPFRRRPSKKRERERPVSGLSETLSETSEDSRTELLGQSTESMRRETSPPSSRIEDRLSHLSLQPPESLILVLNPKSAAGSSKTSSESCLQPGAEQQSAPSSGSSGSRSISAQVEQLAASITEEYRRSQGTSPPPHPMVIYGQTHFWELPDSVLQLIAKFVEVIGKEKTARDRKEPPKKE